MTADAVRLARPTDAADIADVHTRSWRSAYRGLVPDRILERLSVERRTTFWHDTIARRTPDDPARTWVVTSSDLVVGFAHTGPGNDEAAPAPPGAGEVFSIYLAPEAVGRGHGRALFMQATDDLVHRRFDPIVVWVFEENPTARRFYEAAGCRLDTARHDVDFDGVLVPEVRYLLDARAARTALD